MDQDNTVNSLGKGGKGNQNNGEMHPVTVTKGRHIALFTTAIVLVSKNIQAYNNSPPPITLQNYVLP